jgi:hypothetical protein
MQAGAKVYHAGKIGPDGLWVRDFMKEQGTKLNLERFPLNSV